MNPPQAPQPAPAPVWLASPVPSPCTSVCRIDPASGWCAGCRRSLAEIAAWSTMDDEAKRVVWRALPARGLVPGP